MGVFVLGEEMENGIRHSFKPGVADYVGAEAATLLGEISYRDSYKKEGIVVMGRSFIENKYRYFKSTLKECLEKLYDEGFIRWFEIREDFIIAMIYFENYIFIDDVCVEYEMDDE